MDLTDHGIPILFAVAAWWLGTGVILWVCTRDSSTFRWSLGVATILAALAIYGLVKSSESLESTNVYLGFAAAICIWGWLEMSFLMGFVTGPRNTPCPAGVSGWRRFQAATETLIYHELSIAIVAGLLVALTWGMPNQTGAIAFLILMGMRISAKLNIFFGVPNLTDDLMPARLAYLKSYFRKRSFNAFFPFSLAIASAVAIGLASAAARSDAGSAQMTSFMLVLTLLALAILEHVFMVIPIRDSALWRWAAPATSPKSTDEAVS